MAKSSLTLLERFMQYVSPEPNTGCWLYLGNWDQKHYGRFKLGTKSALAHRVSYVLHGFTIPEGMALDHLCRVHCCVNPQHLEPVTNAENGRRGLNGILFVPRKTHCPHGHEYTPENLRISGNRRFCRTCVNDRQRNKWREKQRSRISI